MGADSEERERYIQLLATRFLRYGCHRLFLSSRDFELIRELWEKGVPARVVLTGLDSAFLTRLRSARSRNRPPRSLAFARRQIEKAWEDYRELQVGARAPLDPGRRRKKKEQKLDRLLEAIAESLRLAQDRGHAELAAHLETVRSRLDLHPMTESIFDIEEWLESASDESDRILKRSLSEDVVEKALERAHRELQGYASHAGFQGYVEKMAGHFLREQYPLPLLTLL